VPLPSPPHRPGVRKAFPAAARVLFLSLYCSCLNPSVVLLAGSRELQARWHLPLPVQGKAAVCQASSSPVPSCSLSTSLFPACPAELSPGHVAVAPFPSPITPPSICARPEKWSPMPACRSPAPAAHLRAPSPAGRSPHRTPLPAPSSPTRGVKSRGAAPGGGAGRRHGAGCWGAMALPWRHSRGGASWGRSRWRRSRLAAPPAAPADQGWPLASSSSSSPAACGVGTSGY